MECVECKTSPPFIRVLTCLHGVCSLCLSSGALVKQDNTIRCPECEALTRSPGPGKTHLASLPTCRNPDTTATALSVAGCASSLTAAPGEDEHESNGDSSRSSHTLLTCDSCENTPATSTCLDCAVDLCPSHAHIHRTKRKFQQHRLIDVQARDRGSGIPSGPTCPLHPTNALQVFCQACCDLACKLCLDQGVHSEHSSELQPISEAARAFREHLKRQYGSPIQMTGGKNDLGGGSQYGALTANQTKLESLIEDYEKEAENVSEAISKSFDERINVLHKRAAFLLERVDKLCQRKIKLLQSQAKGLGQCQLFLDRLHRSTEQCCTDVDLLRLAHWERVKREELCYAVQEDMQPTTHMRLAYRPNTTEEQFTESVEKIGVVADLSDLRSLSLCLRNVSDGKIPVRHVKVTLEDSQHKPLPSGAKAYDFVQVELISKLEKDTGHSSMATANSSLSGSQKCGLPMNRFSKCEWALPHPVEGEYTIVASVGHSRQPTSSCDFSVSGTTFDPEKCHKDFTVGQSGTKAVVPMSCGVGIPVHPTNRIAYTTAMTKGVHRLKLTVQSPWAAPFPLCGLVIEQQQPLPQVNIGDAPFFAMGEDGRDYRGHGMQSEPAAQQAEQPAVPPGLSQAHKLVPEAAKKAPPRRRSAQAATADQTGEFKKVVFRFEVDCDTGRVILCCEQNAGALEWLDRRIHANKVRIFACCLSCESKTLILEQY